MVKTLALVLIGIVFAGMARRPGSRPARSGPIRGSAWHAQRIFGLSLVQIAWGSGFNPVARVGFWKR